jgi:hypothetical protein
MSTQDPTISKRSHDLRLRHKRSGDKSYLLWLSPTTQARLARLKREGETLAQLVDRALSALEGVAQSVAEQREIVAKPVAKQQPEDRQRLEVWVPDDLVDSLRTFLLGGVAQFVAQQRESVANSVAEQRLIAQAAEPRAQGLSWEEIARQWNAEGVPTLSGKGQWHRKTITRLVGNE